MEFACISRGSFSGSKALAEAMAKRLGVRCVSREEIVEAAVQRGIAIGKLETAILKPHIFNEQLALEKEHFQAFCTAYLLERALQDSLVYHGRAGHLLFPEVANILRIKVLAEMDYRVDTVMRRLKLDETRARKYIKDVEEDRRRWVKLYYGVETDAYSNYDFVFNLERVGVENAAAMAAAMCELPDFQIGPGSTKAMRNLLLAAQARLALADDEGTFDAPLAVRATNGVVSVVYGIRDAKLADRIPAVLEKMGGVKEVVCTMAQSNILWIQEEFDPGSESFRDIVNLASKWDAAVELLGSEETDAANPQELTVRTLSVDRAAPQTGLKTPRGSIGQNGGVEDDTEEPAGDDAGVKATLNELARMGHSGGGRIVKSAPSRLVEAIDRTHKYTLVVVGNMFLSKGHAAQTRMARELRERIHDRLKLPVVSPEELRQRFLFGKKELFRMLLFVAITAIIYVAVFTRQEGILDFLRSDVPQTRILRTVSILLFVPVIAYLYGSAARLLLKLLRIE